MRPLFASILLSVLVGNAFADTIEWTDPNSGNFNDPNSWTVTSGAGPPPPAIGDITNFNEVGTYTVTLTQNEASDLLNVTAGDVTLVSDSAMLRSFSISTGAADANINGGNLTIGQSGNPVSLDLGDPNNSVLEIGNGTAGSVTVQGAGSVLNAAGSLIHSIGDGASGSLSVIDGAVASVGTFGTLHVAVPVSAASTILVDTGGTLYTGDLLVGTGWSAASGTVTVSGSTSTIDQTMAAGSTLTVGFPNSSGSDTGIINITNGGTYNIGSGLTTVNGKGRIDIQTGGSFNSLGDINVFTSGVFTVSFGSVSAADIDLVGNFTVNAGGSVSAENITTGSITVNGGSVSAVNIDNVSFISGTVELNSDQSFDASRINILGLSSFTAGKTFRVEGTVSLFSTLTLAGGTFSTQSLVSGSFLDFQSGTFELTSDDLVIGPAGLFGPNYILGTASQLNIANTTTIDTASLLVVEDGGSFSFGILNNNGELMLGGPDVIVGGTTVNNAGLIRGLGRINALVSNSGVIETSDQTGELVFNGLVSSSGVIEALGQAGELIFNNAVTNETGGLIAIRDSAVRFSQGLANDGQLSFGPGNSDLLGDVTNDDTIGLSGDAIVSVIGDVAQNATLNLLCNSRLIVFNDFTGTGGSTGPGTLEVLGTISPGASPAEVSFGGDLVLGSRTLIELGGTTKGSQYDALDVTGLASLGGLLDVLLIDGFVPAPGDAFEIITAASILGTFATETLPALAGGLEWFVNYSDTSVELISTFAGDFDFDGDVDGFDFLAWQRGESPDPLSQSDLNDWEANYGMIAPLVAASAAVPEPASMLLMLAATQIFFLRATRRGLRFQ